MQSVRIVMRQIGSPNPTLDIYSPADVSEYIEYQYLSQGYRVLETHYLGEVIDQTNKHAGAGGYKILFVLVKDDEFEVGSPNWEAQAVVENPKAKSKK